ncbi:MAG: ABC transporter ATP-binding protein [Candidatus Gastranaerophilales bacterium]|nr:ABC transporter ATP-binding protein [Candidatus Gastranaerophilales bacterium]
MLELIKRKFELRIRESSMKLKMSTADKAFDYAYLLKRISKYIKPVLPRVILGFLIAIPVGALDGVVAFALKPYMDTVIGQKNMLFATLIPFGIVVFAAIQGLLKYFNSYLTDWTSQKITNAIKIDLYKKLTCMDTRFFDENSSGIILSRFLSDPDVASKGIVENLKTLATAGFGSLALVGVMLYNSWKLAIVGVVVLCVAFLPVALIRKRIKMASNKNMVIGGDITTNCNETYQGNKIITSYNLQSLQQSKFEERIWAAFNVNMSLVKRAGWMSPLMYTIASIGIATVMWYGTHLIISGEMTAGGFTSFVTSLLLLYKPVKTMGNTLTGLQTIFVSIGRVFELFDLEAEIKNSPNAIQMQGLQNNIVFENVHFEYLEGIPVLKNINLDIKTGETLAVVGNSGGGKTTFVNLIPRFYDVTSGAIKIDGINLKEFDIDSLRNNISVVFQDNFLFSGTIKENITMGNKNATQEQLEEVIKAAHLEEMIQTLPNGIETVIGERGTSLSGGQRQRVAIARAMIKNAPIIILDEATSALDNKSEKVVQKALDNLIQNKTVFVIAHRLSTVQNANRIAVINEGVLAELGSHDELMNIENGIYKNLYLTQFNRQEVIA